MCYSERWSLPERFSPPAVFHMLLAALVLVLSGCSSGEQGQKCAGRVETLSGQPLGVLQGRIIDRFSSFSVSLSDLDLDSGPLHSNAPQLYIPSAVTGNGWLAQRLSDHRFTIINAPKDQAITFTCP